MKKPPAGGNSKQSEQQLQGGDDRRGEERNTMASILAQDIKLVYAPGSLPSNPFLKPTQKQKRVQ